ncbi:hypothetical protein P1X15_12920 [Runella sp. MFBS21]|uniref:hypothetical protein n=1 Tax=Runella sp. MFBS21 TaxID=3034018 RepID=UPI0023F9DF6F|nr:hypothetical protein [Runella sp. MFBS21]MDF7818509.1 hypothetical protein [Runella sp. MFBS21]
MIWAGFFGNGVADVIDPNKLSSIPTTLVYGTQDEFLNKIDLHQYVTDIQYAIPHLKVITFEGKHTVDKNTLLQLV